jgi:hypothetical protein
MGVVIQGVGSTQPTVTHPNGARESDTPYRFDLLDPPAMFELAEVLRYGADKYGKDNWRLIDWRSHVNHLLQHAFALLAGDESDNHASHMLARAMFALATLREEQEQCAASDAKCAEQIIAETSKQPSEP